MWLLPSTNPENLHRFFMWARDTGLNSPGLVLVHKSVYETNEQAYKDLIAPKNWNFYFTDAEDFVGQVLEVKHIYMPLPWIGLMGDDCIPLSIQWEKSVLESVVGWNVVSVHDDRKAGSGGIGRGSVWSGDLVRAVGYLFHEGMTEEENYEVWENIAAATACKTHRADLVIRRPGHESQHVNGGPAIQAWLASDAQAEAHKVEDLKTSKGIVKWEVDYTGISVMVAVPTVDGCLEYEFLGCLHETFAMFTQLGVQHEFIVEPFNADIVMARSKMFNKFMRGDCTHLLMIDSDMGWKPQDVGRLFAAKKDFVAVAGPKKRVPLQCAVTPLPLNKNFGQIHFDQASGTVEVHEVGAAFVLLTKEMGRKMIAGYPELAYMGIGGDTEYSLFIPFIMDLAYKAEDYAFCHRWKKLGEKVYVCPDISLKHVGRKVYEGAWTETWPKPEAVPVKEAAE